MEISPFTLIAVVYISYVRIASVNSFHTYVRTPEGSK